MRLCTQTCSPTEVQSLPRRSVSYTHLDVYKRQVICGRYTERLGKDDGYSVVMFASETGRFKIRKEEDTGVGNEILGLMSILGCKFLNNLDIKKELNVTFLNETQKGNKSNLCPRCRFIL